jgi:hypothetical protein
MTYQGWAAKVYSLLRDDIEGGGATYTVNGTVTLPVKNATSYGPEDITTAMAFDLNATKTQASVIFAIGGSVSGQPTGGVGGGAGAPPTQNGTGLNAPAPGLPKTAAGLCLRCSGIGGDYANIVTGANPATLVLTSGANVMGNATNSQQSAYDNATNVGEMGTALRAFWTGLPADFVPSWEPTRVTVNASKFAPGTNGDILPVIIGPVNPANSSGKTVGDLTFFKLLPGGNTGMGTLATGSIAIGQESANGQYRVFNADSGAELAAGDAIPDDGIVTLFYIENNGAWDADTSNDTITDVVTGGFIGGGLVETGEDAPLPTLPASFGALNNAIDETINSNGGSDIAGIVSDALSPAATVKTRGADVMAQASAAAQNAYNSAATVGEMGDALRQHWTGLDATYEPSWEPQKTTVNTAPFADNANNVYPVIIGPVTPANTDGVRVASLEVIKLLPNGNLGSTSLITKARVAIGSEDTDGQYRVLDAATGNELTALDVIPRSGIYIFFYIEDGGSWDEDGAQNGQITDPVSGGIVGGGGGGLGLGSSGCTVSNDAGPSAALLLLLVLPAAYWIRRKADG